MACVIPFFNLLFIFFMEESFDKMILLGKTLNELKSITAEMELPSFAVKQLCEWLYKKKVSDLEQMTNISLKNRTLLAEKFKVGRTAPVQMAESSDGTKKYLFQVDKGFVESVFIPEEDRATLCVSTQVGCKMGCHFCMTGKQGFAGNLSSGDILNQIFSIPESDRLTNLVFMGMGEPMDNTLAVLNALEILTSDYGYAWSPRRITVSSVGLIPGLKVFLEESQCHLAISLHNPISNEREDMMPAQKAYPIKDVMSLLKKYDFSHQRRLSFEYTLFGGKNDTMRHARALVDLIDGMPCRVNLIRFHEIPGADEFKRSTEEQTIWFRDYLNDNRITATIRKSRGEDILAACGMLSTAAREQKQ